MAPFGEMPLQQINYAQTPVGDVVSAANVVHFDAEFLSRSARRYQTIERVVNGTFSMQKEWMLSRGMPWNEEEVGEPSSARSVWLTITVCG